MSQCEHCRNSTFGSNFGSFLPRKLSFGKKQPSERSRHNPAARCCTYRREMVDLDAGLCALPVDLRAIVLSHIEHVKTRQILALSSTFQAAFSQPGALPRTFDFCSAYLVTRMLPQPRASRRDSQVPF